MRRAASALERQHRKSGTPSCSVKLKALGYSAEVMIPSALSKAIDKEGWCPDDAKFRPRCFTSVDPIVNGLIRGAFVKLLAGESHSIFAI